MEHAVALWPGRSAAEPHGSTGLEEALIRPRVADGLPSEGRLKVARQYQRAQGVVAGAADGEAAVPPLLQQTVLLGGVERGEGLGVAVEEKAGECVVEEGEQLFELGLRRALNPFRNAVHRLGHSHLLHAGPTG